MSGGYFDYKQHVIDDIASEIEELIEENDGVGYHYSPATIIEFKSALAFLRYAAVYAQRIDWLVSGDDAEETFHKRLQDDLEKVRT